MLALAGTDVSAYGMCVHTLGMCAGIGRDRSVQSLCAHLGVCAVVGMDRRERVPSVCAHLGCVLVLTGTDVYRACVPTWACVLMLFCKWQICGPLPQDAMCPC